jgi:hypothetical protein
MHIKIQNYKNVKMASDLDFRLPPRNVPEERRSHRPVIWFKYPLSVSSKIRFTFKLIALR